MESSHIREFLEKYRKIIFHGEEERKSVCQAIKDASGMHIAEDAVSIRSNELYIAGNSVVKNELFLHKESILQELHNRGLTNIVDIR